MKGVKQVKYIKLVNYGEEGDTFSQKLQTTVAVQLYFIGYVGCVVQLSYFFGQIFYFIF